MALLADEAGENEGQVGWRDKRPARLMMAEATRPLVEYSRRVADMDVGASTVLADVLNDTQTTGTYLIQAHPQQETNRTSTATPEPVDVTTAIRTVLTEARGQ